MPNPSQIAQAAGNPEDAALKLPPATDQASIDAQNAAQQKALAEARIAETIAKNSAMPSETLSPFGAASLGQSGSDSPVPVGQTVEATGHAKPGTETPPETPPAIEPTPQTTKSVGPIVAAKSPTVKDMIKNVLSGHTGPEGDVVDTTGTADVEVPKKGTDIDWLGMLKKVLSGGGDFLQTWGNGLMHAPGVQTLADTQRAQAFEIQKAKTQNELLQRNMLLDNDYQTKRQALMQTYNVANLTQQAAAERDNRLAELEATYQNEKKLLPQKIAAEMAAYGYGNYQKSGTNPAMTTWGGGR
jgi:hypothetical protein